VNVVKMSERKLYANLSPSQYRGDWNNGEHFRETSDTSSEMTWLDSEHVGSEYNDLSSSAGRPHRGIHTPNFLDIWRYSMCGNYVNSGVIDSDSSSQVFMKESLEQVLDTEAKKVQDEAIVRIQKCTRMFLARKKFLQAKASIHNLQRAIRRYSAR
jgi:hypothetical protein